VARYRILSWRGIPAQVKVFPEGEGKPLSVVLPDKFQQEIDRVAMSEGLIGADAYLEQWQWSEDLERPGSPEEVLDSVLAELEARWDEIRGRR
jgi:hypothetical protein